MSRGVNMTGLRYGSVTAIRCVGRCSDGKWKWLLRCDCGWVAGHLRYTASIGTLTITATMNQVTVDGQP